MAAMVFCQNSTPFSLREKLANLEDNRKNKDEPAASTHSVPHSAMQHLNCFVDIVDIAEIIDIVDIADIIHIFDIVEIVNISSFRMIVAVAGQTLLW